MKQPWKMSGQEWSSEMDATRSDYVQQCVTKNSGSEMAARFARKDFLLFGVMEEAQRMVAETRAGTRTLTPLEREALIERLERPSTHEDVVAKAVREGLPVPFEVLKEYPEVMRGMAPWQLSRDAYFHDQKRVRGDIEARLKEGMAKRYEVRYAYLDPCPTGPIKGKKEVSDPPARGDKIDGFFGRAKVTSIRPLPVHLPPYDLFDEAKREHRASIEAALAIGRQVRSEILAEYPDLRPKTTAAASLGI